MIKHKIFSVSLNPEKQELVASRLDAIYNKTFSRWIDEQMDKWLNSEAKKIKPENWFKSLKNKKRSYYENEQVKQQGARRGLSKPRLPLEPR